MECLHCASVQHVNHVLYVWGVKAFNMFASYLPRTGDSKPLFDKVELDDEDEGKDSEKHDANLEDIGEEDETEDGQKEEEKEGKEEEETEKKLQKKV